VVDSFVFLGEDEIPATVSFSITWQAQGPFHRLRPGSNDPTDPSAFAAMFADALATGTFSGEEIGFTFESDPGASSEGLFAEMGMEQNGVFLR
jgi:hypothetical protein